MTESRIDVLRRLVTDIGQRQREYWHFFPKFADRLETELCQYLGDSSCVALSSAYGEFSFDEGSYRHSRLGLESGRFRIFLMFRLKNLQDNGDLLVRIRLFFTFETSELTAQIGIDQPLRFSLVDLTPLLEHIYQYLRSLFTKENWFEQSRADYSGSAIGFLTEKNTT